MASIVLQIVVVLVNRELSDGPVNPFTTAYFLVVSFGPVLYGWGPNIFGKGKVTV